MIKENKCKNCIYLLKKETAKNIKYYCIRDKDFSYKMDDDLGGCFVILDPAKK